MIVDVSVHNGAINWKTAKASGVEAALIRCGYGRDFTKYDDPKFKANIEGALSAGVVVGVYLYSYAKTSEAALSEAQHALRLINPYKGKIKLPIYYDVEEPGTEKGVKERAILFCDKIKAAGYDSGIYASEYWWKSYLPGIDNNKYSKWVAKWGSVKPEGALDIWQFDAYGKVAGIGSGVDLDRAYNKVAEIIAGKDPEPKGVVTLNVNVLKKGSKGAEVFAVQSILKAKGFKGKDGKVLALDSSWGANVDYAFGNWQASVGLVADKICGAKSWDKLING